MWSASDANRSVGRATRWEGRMIINRRCEAAYEAGIADERARVRALLLDPNTPRHSGASHLTLPPGLTSSGMTTAGSSGTPTPWSYCTRWPSCSATESRKRASNGVRVQLVRHTRPDCDRLAQMITGLCHRRPGKRAKSLSAEHTSSPCSIASAARWASLIRLAVRPSPTTRPLSTSA